jgi:chemotaxis protein methyltransferase CheR
MSARSCANFLEWALPRLALAWPGFRQVHRQVCKRIARRLAALRLPDCAAYRTYLESHPDEWRTLDSFCRIPVSRLWRDRAVFGRLADEVLPALAVAAEAREDRELRCWSAGCASGEEPYSVSILWTLELAARFPRVALSVLASDVDPELLARAACARYRRSSLREVPPQWIERAFTRDGEYFVVRPEFREGVVFYEEDVRQRLPPGPFDLILCRYLVFTYFDDGLQRRTLERLLGTLRPGGGLVIGLKERLPQGATGLQAWVPGLRIYRKAGGPLPASAARSGAA